MPLHELELTKLSIHALELVEHQADAQIHRIIKFGMTCIVEGVGFHELKTIDTRLLGEGEDLKERKKSNKILGKEQQKNMEKDKLYC
jgi:hypothetical protein